MAAASSLTSTDITKSLLKLSEYSDLWTQDDRHLRSGEDRFRLHYAIDPDVLSMYLQPETSFLAAELFSKDREDRNEELPGTPADPDQGRSDRSRHEADLETTKLLAQLLSDFILLDEPRGEYAAPRSTYVLIPPHTEEVLSIMSAIGTRMESATSNLRLIARDTKVVLQSIFDEYKEHGDRGKFASDLAARAPNIVKLASIVADSTTALGRFVRLGPERLMNLFRYNSTAEGRYLADFTETELADSTKDRSVYWMDCLVRARRRTRGTLTAKDERTTFRDAQVLATLEFMNSRLAERQEKILLITASPYIFLAMTLDDPEHPGDLAAREKFAAEVLRHPRWILYHPRFFVPPSDQTDDDIDAQTNLNLKSWIEILAAGRNARNTLGSRTLGADEVQALPELLNQVVHFFAARKYGQSINRLRFKYLEGEINDGVIDQLFDILHSEEWQEDNLEELLKTPATVRLSELYCNSTMLGLLEQPENGRAPGRIMPALRFDSPYTPFNDYYKQVQSLLAKGGARNPKSIEELQRLQKALEENGYDDSYYHRHIIHAAAYAMAELWGPVLTLCGLAIGIADDVIQKSRNTGTRNVVLGREAAFLAAVAGRRSSRNVGDLAGARRSLQDAIARDPFGEGSDDPRFRSEELAIAARQVYFEYFLQRSTSVGSLSRSLINRLEILIRDASKLRESAAQKDDPEVEERVATWVLVQSYANLFTLVLILVHFGSREVIKPNQRAMVGEFWSLLESTADIYDPYPLTVCQIMQIVIADLHGEKHTALCDAVLSRLESAPGKMEYEVGRRQVFRAIVRRYRD